ncbi:MAG: hypothetical protein P4M11_11960 [Candidatus Pacebacteria bacterium]|nr:hypothetical protein [Candidatus Paceibacterota bacterium]
MQWIAIVYGGISSTVFLFITYQDQMRQYIANKRFFPLAFVVLVQTGLVVLAKVYFFPEVQTD